MQFFIHCNFFCQEYSLLTLLYLLTLTRLCMTLITLTSSYIVGLFYFKAKSIHITHFDMIQVKCIIVKKVDQLLL